MIEYHYADLLRQFTEELDKIRAREAKERGEKFDQLYAREQLNYKRYEAALQRCRELLGKVTPLLSGELLDEVKIFHGILADLVHDDAKVAWTTIKDDALEKAEFYKEWLKKREKEGK